jgi:hypothetical protein
MSYINSLALRRQRRRNLGPRCIYSLVLGEKNGIANRAEVVVDRRETAKDLLRRHPIPLSFDIK